MTETEQENAWRTEYRRLKSEKLLAERHLAEKRLQALRRNAPEETDWSSAFLYSQRVKAWTGAAVPYEQWGVYASMLGGALYCGNAYSKAYHVKKAAEAAPDSEARTVHKALAWVGEEQVKHIIALRFQRRGVFAALGAPLIWLAYIQAKHSNSHFNSKSVTRVGYPQQARVVVDAINIEFTF